MAGVSAPVLTSMPRRFSAGSTVSYRRTLPNYPPASWTLKVYLAGALGISATVAEDGADYVVTFSASATTPLPAGAYRFEERVEDASANVYGRGQDPDLDGGMVTVTPNLAAAGAATGAFQLWAEKTVAALEANIYGAASDDVFRFSVGGRTVEIASLKDKMELLRELRIELRSRKSGGPFFRDVQARFSDRPQA